MLISLDVAAFHYLNGVWTNPLFDFIMPIITTQSNWVPLLVILWFLLLFGFRGRFRRLALGMAIVVTLADQASSHLMKPLWGRQRPCCVAMEKRLLVPCSRSKSFPSSHAANSAAVATLVWLEYGVYAGLPLACLSLAISYSRVYVGVHYPLDVLCGMILGVCISYLVVLLSRRCFPIRTIRETHAPEGVEVKKECPM